MPIYAPIVDAFTGSDGTSLTTPARSGFPWVTNPDGSAQPSYQIQSNRMTPDSAGGWIYWDVVTPANHQAAITVPVLPGGSGVVEIETRVINIGTATWSGYAVGVTPGAGSNQFYITRYDSGAGTTLATATSTFSANDELGVECIGSRIAVLKNGVEVTSATDTTYSSAGRAVIYSDGTTVRLDDWRIGAYPRLLGMTGIGS